jgi:hypothetical protein
METFSTQAEKDKAVAAQQVVVDNATAATVETAKEKLAALKAEKVSLVFLLSCLQFVDGWDRHIIKNKTYGK